MSKPYMDFTVILDEEHCDHRLYANATDRCLVVEIVQNVTVHIPIAGYEDWNACLTDAIARAWIARDARIAAKELDFHPGNG